MTNQESESQERIGPDEYRLVPADALETVLAEIESVETTPGFEFAYAGAPLARQEIQQRSQRVTVVERGPNGNVNIAGHKCHFWRGSPVRCTCPETSVCNHMRVLADDPEISRRIVNATDADVSEAVEEAKQ